MSFQGKVFLGQALFFLVALAAYFRGFSDTAGSVLLAVCAIFGVWMGVFLLRVSRRASAGTVDPADEPMAEDVGSFPNATVAAPLLALAVVITVNGLIAGTWLLVIGLVALLLAVVRYAFELAPRRSRPRDHSSVPDSR